MVTQVPNGHVNGDTLSSSQGVETLSRLLLAGWTMLAQTCPRTDCNMPLARSREGLIKCATCGLTNRPSSTSSASSPADQQQQQTSPSNQQAITTIANHRPQQSSFSPSNVPESPVNETDITTQTPSTAVERILTQPPTNPRLLPPPETSSSSDGMESEAKTLGTYNYRRSSTVESAESLIGDRLLRGWTLLSESCTKCGTPLMRDVNRLQHCVVCESQTQTNTVPESERDNDMNSLTTGGAESGQLVTGRRRTLMQSTISDASDALRLSENGQESGVQLADSQLQPSRFSSSNTETAVVPVTSAVTPANVSRATSALTTAPPSSTSAAAIPPPGAVRREAAGPATTRAASAATNPSTARATTAITRGGIEGRRDEIHGATTVEIDDERIDIDAELEAAQRAAARALRTLRVHLGEQSTRDSEGMAATMSAMQKACDLVGAARSALNTGGLLLPEP